MGTATEAAALSCDQDVATSAADSSADFSTVAAPAAISTDAGDGVTKPDASDRRGATGAPSSTLTGGEGTEPRATQAPELRLHRASVRE